MFRSLRSLSEALHSLSSSLQSISDLLPEVLQAVSTHEPLEERLAELERDRHQWEARVEAELVRADSKFKSARAAEERTRTMTAHERADEDGAESEEDLGARYLELLQRNAQAGADETVQSVPEGVAVDAKTRALQAKFGVAI